MYNFFPIKLKKSVKLNFRKFEKSIIPIKSSNLSIQMSTNKLKIINDPVHGFIKIPYEILYDV